MSGSGSSFLVRTGANLPATFFTWEQFGATDSGADDTTAITDFNTAAAAVSGNVVLHIGAGKAYEAENAYWSFNIASLLAQGNGASFTTIQINGNDGAALSTAAGLARAVPGQSHPIVSYYPFQTANIGATSIFTLTPAHAANFSSGEWVFLGARENGFGSQFPPDRQQWQFLQVAENGNAATGEVKFTSALTQRFRADAICLTTTDNSTGVANIYKLEQYSDWYVAQEFTDLTLINPNGTWQYANLTGYDITMVRCNVAGVLGYFNSTIAWTVTTQDCLMGEMELDKSVVQRNVLGDTIDNFTNGCNITNLLIDGANVVGGSASSQIASRNVIIRNTTLAGGISVLSATAPAVESLLIEDSTFSSRPSVNFGGPPRITIGSGGWALASGILTKTLSSSMTSAETAFIDKIKADEVTGDMTRIDVVTLDATSSLYRQTGNFGYATDAYSTVGSNVASFVTEFYSDPGSGILMCSDEPLETMISNLDVGGGVILNQTYVTECSEVFEYTGDVAAAGGLTSLIPSALLTNSTLLVRGKLVNFEVEVIRAYTGGQAGNFDLQVYSICPGGYQGRLNRAIDLKTTGLRVATPTTNSGWTGTAGESAGANLPTTWATGFMSGMQVYAPAKLGTGSELARVRVRLEFTNPDPGEFPS